MSKHISKLTRTLCVYSSPLSSLADVPDAIVLNLHKSYGSPVLMTSGTEVHSWSSSSPEQTHALGAFLGTTLQAGSVVALIGDLGAGKTCFVQGFAQGAGVAPQHAVTSPTYALMHTYPAPTPITHIDFYRLHDSEELAFLGIEEEIHRCDTLTVIEWADRFSEFLPPHTLTIEIIWESLVERRFTIRGLPEGAKLPDPM
jgi:tRNA threonylcarbamoyladenosine biosynthesis protein TsaE